MGQVVSYATPVDGKLHTVGHLISPRDDSVFFKKLLCSESAVAHMIATSHHRDPGDTMRQPVLSSASGVSLDSYGQPRNDASSGAESHATSGYTSDSDSATVAAASAPMSPTAAGGAAGFSLVQQPLSVASNTTGTLVAIGHMNGVAVFRVARRRPHRVVRDAPGSGVGGPDRIKQTGARLTPREIRHLVSSPGRESPPSDCAEERRRDRPQGPTRRTRQTVSTEADSAAVPPFSFVSDDRGSHIVTPGAALAPLPSSSARAATEEDCLSDWDDLQEDEDVAAPRHTGGNTHQQGRAHQASHTRKRGGAFAPARHGEASSSLLTATSTSAADGSTRKEPRLSVKVVASADGATLRRRFAPADDSIPTHLDPSNIGGVSCRLPAHDAHRSQPNLAMPDASASSVGHVALLPGSTLIALAGGGANPVTPLNTVLLGSYKDLGSLHTLCTASGGHVVAIGLVPPVNGIGGLSTATLNSTGPAPPTTADGGAPGSRRSDEGEVDMATLLLLCDNGEAERHRVISSRLGTMRIRSVCEQRYPCAMLNDPSRILAAPFCVPTPTGDWSFAEGDSFRCFGSTSTSVSNETSTATDTAPVAGAASRDAGVSPIPPPTIARPTSTTAVSATCRPTCPVMSFNTNATSGAPLWVFSARDPCDIVLLSWFSGVKISSGVIVCSHNHPVASLACSHSGRYIVSASERQTVLRLWQVRPNPEDVKLNVAEIALTFIPIVLGDFRHSYSPSAAIRALAMSPQDDVIAVYDQCNHLKLFDAKAVIAQAAAASAASVAVEYRETHEGAQIVTTTDAAASTVSSAAAEHARRKELMLLARRRPHRRSPSSPSSSTPQPATVPPSPPAPGAPPSLPANAEGLQEDAAPATGGKGTEAPPHHDTATSGGSVLLRSFASTMSDAVSAVSSSISSTVTSAIEEYHRPRSVCETTLVMDSGEGAGGAEGEAVVSGGSFGHAAVTLLRSSLGGPSATVRERSPLHIGKGASRGAEAAASPNVAAAASSVWNWLRRTAVPPSDTTTASSWTPAAAASWLPSSWTVPAGAIQPPATQPPAKTAAAASRGAGSSDDNRTTVPAATPQTPELRNALPGYVQHVIVFTSEALDEDWTAGIGAAPGDPAKTVKRSPLPAAASGFLPTSAKPSILGGALRTLRTFSTTSAALVVTDGTSMWVPDQKALHL